MINGGDFQGSIVVDGLTRSNVVGVFLDGTVLSLREVHKHGLSKLSIILIPFNSHMILTQRAQRMRDGWSFDIKGDHVGIISEGPLGHPGDGDYNSRTITSFKAAIAYFVDHIHVRLDGASIADVDVLNEERILPAVQFSASFDIPKEQITAFFQLNAAASTNTLAAYHDAFPGGR